jgi:hypothetical protein
MKMKMQLQGECEGSLDFMLVPVSCPCCSEQRHILVGFGTDGTMWIEAGVLGIGPEHAGRLEKFDGPYLLFSAARQLLLINARAVVLVRTEPEWGRRWLAFVEEMVKQHKEVRAQYESSRNN